MKLQAGKYPARIKSYGVGKPSGNAKRPPIFVEFEANDSMTGESGSVFYWGSLDDAKNPNAKKHPYEITIDNLIRLGLKGNDPYSIADNAPGALNSFREYELVLEEQEYQGKKSIRVKYINLPGSGGVKEKLSHQEAKQMSGFNFAGAVMAARQQLGIKEETQTETSFGDIPF